MSLLSCTISNGILPSRSLKRPECSLEVQGCDSSSQCLELRCLTVTAFKPFKGLNLSLLKPLISPSLFVSVKYSRTCPFIGPWFTYVRKSSVCSRNLNCCCCVVPPADTRVAEFPHEDQSLQSCRLSCKGIAKFFCQKILQKSLN